MLFLVCIFTSENSRCGAKHHQRSRFGTACRRWRAKCTWQDCQQDPLTLRPTSLVRPYSRRASRQAAAFRSPSRLGGRFSQLHDTSSSPLLPRSLREAKAFFNHKLVRSLPWPITQPRWIFILLGWPIKVFRLLKGLRLIKSKSQKH